MVLQPDSQRTFISYRATDASITAQDLNKRLEKAGYYPWLDEAKEHLSPGTDVQAVISKQIEQASMVLVVDTPAAPESTWIDFEIDLAGHRFIPVLPVVVGQDISRFITLKSLERTVPIKPGGVDGEALSNEDWGP
jgi:hypothetical protein